MTATARVLDALFDPRSVAVVGASPDRHYSRSIVANLRQHGYGDERIFPVNPRYDTVDGLACFPSLDALPDSPDTVAVLLGRNAVAGVVEQIGAVGARAALIIADGYAEESPDGRAAQQALGQTARLAGLGLLGPNTLGYVVPSTGAGMWCAGALPHPLRPGGIALLAQSSGMLNLLMGVAGQRALGIRACVSVGNAEVLGLPELIEHFVADPDCTTLGLVIESIDRPRALMNALASARSAGKPVVALKIGISELGQRNSIAHTGRMAGPAQGWTALFDRLDICAARDMDDLVETLTVFGALSAPATGSRGLGVALATISGGETSLVCDIAEQEGLSFARLDDATLSTLRGRLGKPSMIGNPLDLQNTRTSRPEVFRTGLQALSSDRNVDVVAVRLNLNACPDDRLREMYREVVGVIRAGGARPVVLTRAYEYLELGWWQFFSDLDVPFVLSYRNSLHALAQCHRWLLQLQLRNQLPDNRLPSAVPLTTDADAGEIVPLGAGATRDWLSAAGVEYVASATVPTARDAAAVAASIGYPLVLKAVGPDLVHKSEVGGVELGLVDAAAVEAAADRMQARVARATGRRRDEIGFEVQRMIAEGIELIVGMNLDPTWGPVLMIGSGGIYAETVGDVVWDLPPVDHARARELLQRLRIWPMLDGARGRKPADVDALIDLVVRFGDAVANASLPLAGIDLNPVVVGTLGQGAVAVDASVLIRRSAGSIPSNGKDRHD